jgi:hypothetical protein
VSPTALIKGIREAAYHQGGIRCLQLMHVNESFFRLLRREIERLCQLESPSDVRGKDHVTNWTRPKGEVRQFSLLNSSGQFSDFSQDHDFSCLGKTFHAASHYPTLARFIGFFPHTINFRINLMGPRACLAAHEEHPLFISRTGSVALRLRFHLPIVTDHKAELTLDGFVYCLVPGTIYLVNHGCVHSARNGADDPRIHLVWDELLTSEVFAFMFEDVPDREVLCRIPPGEREPNAVRTERVGAFLSLPPLVTREQAMQAGLCRVQ